MRRISLLLGLVLCAAGTAQAQSTERPTTEIFVGPSIMRNGVSAPHYSLYGGWQTQGSFNFNEHFGVTLDFGGQYRSITGIGVSQYEYLFGPRVKTSIRRATVFAHGLVGANTFRAKLSGQSQTLNGFAAGVGGGLDYSVSRHFAVRVIQADYLRTRLSNTWFHDARLAVGVVVKF